MKKQYSKSLLLILVMAATLQLKAEFVDYYAVLEVSESAETTEIRKSYRKLMNRYHPDKGMEADAKKAQTLNEAYEILRNSEKRKLYDLERRRFNNRPSPRTKETTHPDLIHPDVVVRYYHPSYQNFLYKAAKALGGQTYNIFVLTNNVEISVNASAMAAWLEQANSMYESSFKSLASTPRNLSSRSLYVFDLLSAFAAQMKIEGKDGQLRKLSPQEILLLYQKLSMHSAEFSHGMIMRIRGITPIPGWTTADLEKEVKRNREYWRALAQTTGLAHSHYFHEFSEHSSRWARFLYQTGKKSWLEKCRTVLRFN